MAAGLNAQIRDTEVLIGFVANESPFPVHLSSDDAGSGAGFLRPHGSLRPGVHWQGEVGRSRVIGAGPLLLAT